LRFFLLFYPIFFLPNWWSPNVLKGNTKKEEGVWILKKEDDQQQFGWQLEKNPG
jgi:hypothetical protein